jgi:hypothetical protein
MRLMLKGVSTKVDIQDGTTVNTFDFIDDEGDPADVLSIPVSPESVQYLMEALGQTPAAEEPPEPEEEEPPPALPQVPQRQAQPAFQSARKRLTPQGPGADDGVQPL